MRSSVVLPQPDGPSSVKNSPSPTVEVDIVDGAHRAEAARDARDDDAAHLSSPVSGEVRGVSATEGSRHQSRFMTPPSA